MRITKLMRLLLIFLIISGISGFVLAGRFSESRFSYIVDSHIAPDGTVYVIDDDGKEVSILKLTAKGSFEGRIDLQKKVKGKSRDFDQISVDTDGTVYVYQKEKDIRSNAILSENIYSCDFEQEKISLAWQLPVKDPEDQNCFSVHVKDGTAYYFTINYNAEKIIAQAILNKVVKGGSPQEVNVVEYDIGSGFTDLFHAENGDIVFSTPDGDVLRKTAAGEYENLYPDNSGQESTEIANFSPDGENKVYLDDIKKGVIVCIDLSTGESRIVDDIGDFVQGEGQKIKYSDIKKIRHTPEGKFSASLYKSDKTTVLMVYDNKTYTVVSDAKPPVTRYLKYAAIIAGITFGSLILLRIVVWLYMKITGSKIPIIVKQILVFIPIVIISMLIMQQLINTKFTKELVDSQYKELYLVSRQKTEAISSDLLKEINLERPYNDVYYFELRQIVTALPSSAEVYDIESPEKGPVKINNFSYYWLHLVKDGKLVTLFCDQNYVNIPIDYMYNSDTVELFNKALKEKKSVRSTTRDVGGDWIILVTPIFDAENNVVALMETGTTKASMELKVSDHTNEINKINLITLSVMIVCLLIMLFISLYPLKRLKKGVQAITDGELGVQVKVTGKDEITEIANVFNKMSLHIHNHVGELTSLNEGYYKFVPSKMFEMLRKTSVTDVKLGDQTKAEITILTFNAVGFDEMVSTMSADEMFKLINNIFSNLIPIVIKNGGVVDKFYNAGLVAFFTEGSERALNAAISICQCMDLVNQQETIKNPVHMTMAISHGPVMIGIVGHERRLSATTISEHSNLTGFLRGIAPKYSSRILTTGSAISKISDFNKKYNSRLIGFLYIRNEDTAEKLYDVFDGDTADMKHMKKQTKELFEKGVSLYCAREFYEARLVFIEVLKQFREDSAAKEYLYLCDNYYQKDTSDIDIYIEKF